MAAGRRALAVCLSAILVSASVIPAHAESSWQTYQAERVNLNTASASLKLSIPFGGAGSSETRPTVGLSLAAGTSEFGSSHGGFRDPYGDPVRSIHLLNETPLFYTGLTLDGETFADVNYANMVPSSDTTGRFLDGDMDGGEAFIFAAALGGAFALFIYLNDGDSTLTRKRTKTLEFYRYLKMELFMSDEAEGTLHELGPGEVNSLLSSGKAILIDVREPTEYGAERIPGALNFPLSTFDPAYLPLDTNKRVIFHCGGGGRSSRAARSLFSHGQKESTHLAGGIRGWKAEGLPVISLDPTTGKPVETRSA